MYCYLPNDSPGEVDPKNHDCLTLGYGKAACASMASALAN